MLDLTYKLTAAALLGLLPACIVVVEGEDDETDTEAGSTSRGETTGGPLGSTGRPDPTEGQDESTTTAADTSGGQVPEADPAIFFTEIAGLWVAPVTSWTSVGNFPTMNMDVRAASDRVLFSRIDLDPENNLRFAFAIEEHDGEPQLVYRNGGYFVGILRDTRTVLESYDGNVWRFCALEGGCAYVDARFDFSGDDAMRLDVDVMGMRHIEWNAVRREARALEGDFPTPETLPGDAPFPDMPELMVQASWDTPLEADADVWVVLSNTDCGIDPINNCVPSRYMRAVAGEGDTSVTMTLEQIHDGTYSVNAVLDRNRNMTAGILLPDMGDGISWPLDVSATVPASGTGEVDLLLNMSI